MALVYVLLTFFLLALASAPTLYNNPVRSVIAVIIVFLFVACLLIHINIEFLAYVYAIVYLGAVAVLFLFVVMLLKVSVRYHASINVYVIFLLLGFIALTARQLVTLILKALLHFNVGPIAELLQRTHTIEQQSIIIVYSLNTFISELHSIASRFYSVFSMLFIETAFVLLIALIAVIVLTSNELKQK